MENILLLTIVKVLSKPTESYRWEPHHSEPHYILLFCSLQSHQPTFCSSNVPTHFCFKATAHVLFYCRALTTAYFTVDSFLHFASQLVISSEKLSWPSYLQKVLFLKFFLICIILYSYLVFVWLLSVCFH